MLCNHRPRTACTVACIRVQHLHSSNQPRQIYLIEKLPGKVLILGAVCLRRNHLPVSNWTQQSYRTCAFLRNAPSTPRIEMLNIPYAVSQVKGVDSRSSENEFDNTPVTWRFVQHVNSAQEPVDNFGCYTAYAAFFFNATQQTQYTV
jgi:hypothetical protein